MKSKLEHLQSLKKLQAALQKSVTDEERLTHLNQNSSVLETDPRLFTGLSFAEELLIKQLAAIGQAARLFPPSHVRSEKSERLITQLQEIDTFYRELGGLVGYQTELLQLLHTSPTIEAANYHAPPFIDISKETLEAERWIQEGILALPRCAEIYPVGGAADRLHLVDSLSGVELPAAKLRFAGRTLLEGIVRDLQGREELYFQRTGLRCLTPVALMTSEEKQNHDHILSICEEHDWFGRPKELFRFFTQPLVPTIDMQGNWILTGPMKLLLKPGGHGVIWKLARDRGIFDWFRNHNRDIALVRQINNPLAGLDYGLTAFLGIGAARKMHFGFASCPRQVKAAEGVNVLVERTNKVRQRELFLTNIEYCDFSKRGIEDAPRSAHEPYSLYPSNTNLLFTNLSALEEALHRLPFPGLLLNLKKGRYRTESGERREETIGRLEATMQNITDAFVEHHEKGTLEKTFITYNERRKTISTAKRAYFANGPLEETPERCFYDLLQAARDLLQNHCKFRLPLARSEAEYLRKGPDIIFLYRPAMGPLYSIIRKKIRGGELHLGSELQLDLTDLDIQDLDLNGSLSVSGEGRCLLHHVSIENRGVDWKRSTPFWRGDFTRQENVSIQLEKESEFIAENVIFRGTHLFEVERGVSMRVFQESDGSIRIEKRERAEHLVD